MQRGCCFRILKVAYCLNAYIHQFTLGFGNDNLKTEKGSFTTTMKNGTSGNSGKFASKFSWRGNGSPIEWSIVWDASILPEEKLDNGHLSSVFMYEACKSSVDAIILLLSYSRHWTVFILLVPVCDQVFRMYAEHTFRLHHRVLKIAQTQYDLFQPVRFGSGNYFERILLFFEWCKATENTVHGWESEYYCFTWIRRVAEA